MATGIGPSSSGSQATVASVVTSTLLAGLGFSGGVISSFPSSVWPSRSLTHNPTTTTEPAKDATTSASAVTTATAKDNHEAGNEDRETSKGQGEDGEREGEDKDEEEEEEEEKEQKKEKKGSGGVGKAGTKDNSTVAKEPPRETPDSTAKEKKQTEPHPTDMLPGADQIALYTNNPLDFNPTVTTEAANDTGAFPAPKDPTGTLRPSTGRDKKHWPFSIHTGKSTDVLKSHVNNQLWCSGEPKQGVSYSVTVYKLLIFLFVMESEVSSHMIIKYSI